MKILLFLLMFSSVAFAQERPNIIYIMSDDHDADAISAYNSSFLHTPSIDRLAKEGILFRNAFVGNSICSPARATLLTGQHSHKNGVKDNRTPFDPQRSNIAKLMQTAGYQTALVGKWHLHTYPSGFDYWKIFPGQGEYYDPRFISMMGDTTGTKGYATDVVTSEAISWLQQRDKSKPFVLFIHHKAPHRNFLPKAKHLAVTSKKTYPEPASLYNDSSGRGAAWRIQTMSILPDMHLTNDLKIDPAFLENSTSFKPDSNSRRYYQFYMNRIPAEERTLMKEIYAERGKIMQSLAPSGKQLLKYKYQWYMQDFMGCVASIDENVGRVLDYVDQQGLSDNTIVIYTSDQGFFLGENGWFDKRFMYDVSMQTPLLIRWPGRIRAATTNMELVQNIDYAPTILDLAGVNIPDWIQGLSLKPLVTGKTKKLNRDELYYHYYEYGRDHTVIPHLGIRGERYKLIYYYTVNEWELYDLRSDPNEQVNLIGSSTHEEVFKDMKNKLLKLRDLYDDHEPAGELK